MAITIHVRNYRGAERCDVECVPIALIGAVNGAGKSSVVQAIAAALTGKALPIGMTKGSAATLVKTGTSNASAEIRSDAGSVKMTWPACEASSAGEPPRASTFAAGLSSIADLTPKERAGVLAEYLHSDPSREDLAAELTDAGIGDPPIVDALWQLIERSNWDDAYAARKTKGAEMKGAWRQVTGQNYGSQIARAWKPAGWADDLDVATESDLNRSVIEARQAHENAIASAAASGVRRDQLAAEADRFVERLTTATTAAETVKGIEAELADLRAQKAAVPAPETRVAATPFRWPCCGEALELSQSLTETTLAKAAPMSQPPSHDEVRLVRRRRAELDGAISNAEGRLGTAKDGLRKAEAGVESSRRAEADLATLPEATVASGDVEAAKTAANHAVARLGAFRTKAEADGIQAKIASNDLALAVLAPDGLRARKLAKVLDVFNGAKLAPLSAAANWKSVAIDADMAVTYGDRVYSLLSASEQYRVRIILQLAMAELDGSTMTLHDAADILDAPTRSGLLSLLISAGRPAIVALTLSQRAQLPDIAKAGAGISYWLNDGIAERIDSADRQQAA